MRVITREQVKIQLGITDSSLDAQIDAKLPIIDAKVKQITGNRFNMQINATLSNGSAIAPVTSINNINEYYTYEDLGEYLQIGDMVEGSGIPTETHIDEVYYNGEYYEESGQQYTTPVIKLSNNATLDGLKRIVVGFNIGYHDIIAKGVQYLISGTNQSLPQNRLKSKSLPPLSVTYADNTVHKTYGMPNWFVEALPTYMGGH